MPACHSLQRRLLLSSVKPVPFFPCTVQPRTQTLSLPYRARFCLSQTPNSFRTYYTHPPFLKEPRRASSTWSLVFAFFAIGTGAWLQNRYFGAVQQQVPDAPLQPPQASQQDLFLGVIDTLKTMPSELPPGTVGNLTAEQEAKLQELWVLTLRLFGVELEESDEATESSRAPSPSREKKKSKRRFGLFGKKEEETQATQDVLSSRLAQVIITDGDDKYGQSKEFQQALADIPPEELRKTFWDMVKHDNPDSLLLRFLRARKWDVKKALIMFVSTIRWRLQDVKVDDDVMKNGEALAFKQSQSSNADEKQVGEEFLAQIRMGKSFLHGVDKLGRPICVVRVRLHKAGEQSEQTLERYTVYTIESARMMLAPPVETATIVFDMSNFTLANMDYTPVKFMIKCFEANYPESLGSVLVHKAPWIFSSIWNIIKGWLDPVVAAKVHFTKTVEDLEEFIPRSQIIKELGGDEDFEYKYIEVNPDENKKMEDTATRDALVAKRHELDQEIQDATLAWVLASARKDTAAAAAAQKKRNELIEKLRVQYWELDPYIRARSYYDRIGVLQGGGKLNFYPQSNKTSAESEKEAENIAIETTPDDVD
ncbi:hypothetical protein ASPZODRAFT_129578 [Penicilliopsis zonata CBS 506.65]|uniref:CRAL-TRIO domain-containing protein n=1 Tax=Penicilliopsis zonata CBS 506.65 TaxID=1073090 RepID=A0A1L9SPN6_9EURO|nr:hypothetical protein ASPZODRAFT_129578 [Penicilliopsis zonata CBS 506.65]OJJ49170.1 hypothetical protein ASPZODRAFT_129578 [Penicilliopsis zonata CBS 506.65]